MAWTQLGPRKGARRLPEKKRRRILKRYPQCQLAIPGVCTGTSTQVHHLRDAADFDNPNDPRIDAEQIDGRPQLIGVCAMSPPRQRPPLSGPLQRTQRH
jgi:5-methylcytosine-specific restriction enzyme A